MVAGLGGQVAEGIAFGCLRTFSPGSIRPPALNLAQLPSQHPQRLSVAWGPVRMAPSVALM